MKFQQINNKSSLIFDSEIVNTSQNHNKKAKTEEYINYLSPFYIDFRRWLMCLQQWVTE